MAQLTSLTVNDTGSLTLPSGTIANRPSLSSTVIVQWSNTGTQSVSTLSGSASTTSTSWTCPAGVNSIEVLVVAGGGAGGGYHGGGGGAGGVIYNSTFPVTASTTYSVTVGQGGSAATQTSNTGNPGSNSVFATLTAIGGGAGLSQGSTPQARNNGGSGGGASDNNTGTFTTGGSGTAGQGHSGGGFFGDGNNALVNYPTSGGGGAGGPGTGADSVSGGAGGPGLCFDITGTPTYYGGGGGGTQLGVGATTGFSPSAAYGLGGIGGGGTGGYTLTTGGAATRNSTSGVNGTGGGGGGFQYSNLGGGAGGSGTVVIRYSLATATTQPAGQSRFNTITKTFENYEPSNKWKTAPIGEKIVTDGLVAHLDGVRYGSSTTWTDLSGQGNHATLTNGPSYTADNGGAIVFDGSDDHAISGTFTQHQTTRITLSAWVYPTQVSSDSYVISVGGGSSGNARGIRVNGSIWSAIGYGSAGTHDFNDTGATAVANQWQHVCAVWDGTSVTFYLNGRITRTTTCSGLVTPVGSVYYIGLPSWSTSAAWTGRIACASIYKKSLTQDEVRQNYNAQRSRFELTSPVENQQSYITDKLLVNLDISDPSCNPPLSTGITTAKLYDNASGSIGTPTNGAIPIATPNYEYILLDGTNDFIAMSSPKVYLGVNCTYDFWIYPTSLKDATYQRAYIIDPRGDGSDSGCSSYFLWDYSSAGVVNFITGNSGTEVQATGVPLSVNAWHHIAATRDGQVWRIYLDGQLVGQGNTNFTALTLNNSYRIGTYSAWGFSTAQYALPGYVGAARIYGKTLSSSEIMTNYQAMKNRYGT